MKGKNGYQNYRLYNNQNNNKSNTRECLEKLTSLIGDSSYYKLNKDSILRMKKKLLAYKYDFCKIYKFSLLLRVNILKRFLAEIKKFSFSFSKLT